MKQQKTKQVWVGKYGSKEFTDINCFDMWVRALSKHTDLLPNCGEDEDRNTTLYVPMISQWTNN